MWYGMTDLGKSLLGIRPKVNSYSLEGIGQEADKSLITNHRGLAANSPSLSMRKDEFWSLQDISFELKRGECLGLIGRNGSGKTTLLRLLTGIFPPDAGEITVRGRVGALIALGSGFHPHMTGRENIYLNGTILGLSRDEIHASFDSIVDFADIGDFLDSPVSTYSSGMTVRLGFAIATALKPDLLVLDEVLAVGDAAFRNKCYNRIGKLKNKAGVIFVSHAMDQVSQFCDRSLVLSSGHQIHFGEVKAGIEIYEKLLGGNRADVDEYFEKFAEPVTAAQVILEPSQVAYGGDLCLTIQVALTQPVSNALLKIVLYDEQHKPFAQWASEHIGAVIHLRPGNNILRVHLGPLLFRTGQYRLGVVLNGGDRISMLLWSYKKLSFALEGAVFAGPVVALQATLSQSEENNKR